MLKPRSLEELVELGLGDAEIQSISWLNAGGDLVIALAASYFPGEIAKMTFSWVSDLEIEMRFGLYLGSPLIFGAELLKEGRVSRFRLLLEAAPSGVIEFAFNKSLLEWERLGGPGEE